jgi:hypothetical protein
VPPRVALALIAVLVAALVAGCGGGSDDERTVGTGGEAFTVPNDTHGVYSELEAILDQLPYEAWYTKCVVAQVKKTLTPAEAEALAELPEAEREEKAVQVTSQAGPACEAEHHLPVVDPHASSRELDLLRAGYVSWMTALAEQNGATDDQIACVENGFEELPEKELIAVINGAKSVREGILLSVFKPCSAG